jgi:hypothetical protein
MAQLNSHSSIFRSKPRTLADIQRDLKNVAIVEEK